MSNHDDWLFYISILFVLFTSIIYLWFDELVVWWGRLWCRHVYRVVYESDGSFLYLKCSACGKRSR